MKRILIVEDNDMNLDMISRRLERRGFATLAARDGQEGVTQARKEIPDLVLMDISLPIMDGWEATRQLKADAATAAIPIVILTAHAMEGDRDRAAEVGSDGFATKPVDFPALLETINALLPE